jgi:hypothetical protein
MQTINNIRLTDERLEAESPFRRTDMETASDAIDTLEPDDRVPAAWLRSTRVECECPEFCLVDHNN